MLVGVCCTSMALAGEGASDRERSTIDRKTLLQKLKERSAVKRWRERASEGIRNVPVGVLGRTGHSEPVQTGPNEVPGAVPPSPSPALAAPDDSPVTGAPDLSDSEPPDSETALELFPAPTASSVTVVQPEPEPVEPQGMEPTEPEEVPLDLPDFEDIPRPEEPERDPAQLPKVTKILPYRDYSPEYDTGIAPTVCPEGKESEECPEEVPLSRTPFTGRSFEASVFQWEATNVFHNPLYFEDYELERYGHVRSEYFQPLVSTARFGVQLVGLPYQMTIDPVRKKMYPLGHYRYGDCFIPQKFYRIPWNTKAAAVEAGAWTGLFFIFP